MHTTFLHSAFYNVRIVLTQQTGKLGFIVPSERWHSQNARENGLPHQPDGWFAMTSFFVFSLFYRSVTLQRYVIANQGVFCKGRFYPLRKIHMTAAHLW